MGARTARYRSCRFAEQFLRCLRDITRRNAKQALMMSFRTYAAITVAARNVVKQHPIFYLPRGVLRIGQRIQIDDRCAECGRQVDWARIIRNQ